MDNNIASYACYQLHFETLMENYSNPLTATGSFMTTERGMDSPTPGARCKLSEADLAFLEQPFSFCRTKTAYGIYTPRNQAGPWLCTRQAVHRTL